MSWTQWPGRFLGMLTCRPTRHRCTSRAWSKCYSYGRIDHALIHLSKGNIKSFLGVIPHVNTSWINLYMIKSIEFTVHCQAANSRMICTYLPSLLPTTLVLRYPRMEWPSSRMGWPYLQLHWQDTANVGHVFTSRYTSIPKTCCFRYPGWPSSICLEKLESWWVAHWLLNQIRVPLVVTNVSQLHETIMWVCSVRSISYQWYSRFLLFNMSRRWRKSAHC